MCIPRYHHIAPSSDPTHPRNEPNYLEARVSESLGQASRRNTVSRMIKSVEELLLVHIFLNIFFNCSQFLPLSSPGSKHDCSGAGASCDTQILAILPLHGSEIIVTLHTRTTRRSGYAAETATWKGRSRYTADR